MTKHQTGSNTASGRKPQPSIDDIREKFAKFRDRHPVNQFDEAFLNIIHQAAYKGSHVPFELADGLFYYRFIRAEFTQMVWLPSYTTVTVPLVAERIGQFTDFNPLPFDVALGSLLQAAIENNELDSAAIAAMHSVYQDVKSILYMVSCLNPNQNNC